MKTRYEFTTHGTSRYIRISEVDNGETDSICILETEIPETPEDLWIYNDLMVQEYGLPEYVYSLEAGTILEDAMMMILWEFFENHTLPIEKLETFIKDFSSVMDLNDFVDFLAPIYEYSYQEIMDKIAVKPAWHMIYYCLKECYEDRYMGKLLRYISTKQ